jgi:hypothetical protein
MKVNYGNIIKEKSRLFKPINFAEHGEDLLEENLKKCKSKEEKESMMKDIAEYKTKITLKYELAQSQVKELQNMEILKSSIDEKDSISNIRDTLIQKGEERKAVRNERKDKIISLHEKETLQKQETVN